MPPAEYRNTGMAGTCEEARTVTRVSRPTTDYAISIPRRTCTRHADQSKLQYARARKSHRLPSRDVPSPLNQSTKYLSAYLIIILCTSTIMLVDSHLQKHLLGDGCGDAHKLIIELMTDDCRECEIDIAN